MAKKNDKQKNQAKGNKPHEKAPPSEEEGKYANVSLITHPILTIKIIAILLGRLLKSTVNLITHHILLILAFSASVAAFYLAPGPHEVVSST